MAERVGLTGHNLLNDPCSTKAVPFGSDRRGLNLLGLLPYRCSTVEEQRLAFTQTTT
jgi:hypothetical protein